MRQHFGQYLRAYGVYRAGPAGGFERLGRLRQFGALDNACCAEAAQQIAVLLGAAGYGGHAVAELVQQRDGHGAHAAAGAGNQNFAALGRDVLIRQGLHTQHGGEAGGADNHGLAGAERSGQRHEPIAVDAGFFGQTAPMFFAHAPAGEYHFVAAAVARVRRFNHGAGKIDAGHHRILLHDFDGIGERQPVFIIDGGIFNGHGYIARRQPRFIQRFDGGGGVAVGLIQYQSFKHKVLLMVGNSAAITNGRMVWRLKARRRRLSSAAALLQRLGGHNALSCLPSLR